MIPTEVFPSGTPFTDHHTVGFELPVTVVVKDRDPPARMFADGGAIVTEIDAGADGEDGAEGVAPVLPGPDVVAAQPTLAITIANAIRVLRKSLCI
jgi:hypothetical protein